MFPNSFSITNPRCQGILDLATELQQLRRFKAEKIGDKRFVCCCAETTAQLQFLDPKKGIA